MRHYNMTQSGKMERTWKLILILPVLLLFVSCGEDFTHLNPISERNVENFYQTETDFQQAIEGAYAGLANSDAYGRNYSLLLELRGDNTSYTGASGLGQVYFRIAHFQELATASQLASTWIGSYRGIARTNTILARIENLDDENLADRIRGEALFIRSLFYYNLAVIFGNIPIQLDEVSGPDVEINQVSAGEIYSQIAGDLETAEELLPASYSDPGDVGRVTSGAAATLLGLVQLTAGNNAAAETALRRVIDSGQYELVPDYADIWGPANENNVESIFELQYQAGGTETGSGFTEFFTPFGLSGGVGGGNAPQSVTDDVLNAFEDGDERFWGGTFDSTETGNVYIKKFESQPFGPFDADNNFIVFRYADVLLMLAEAIGESPEAYGYINEVRARSELDDISATDPGTFEEKLLRERRLEFVAENKRWPDLLRFDMATEVMTEFLIDEGLVNEVDVRLLYPIPQGEIDSSPEDLVQNDF